MIKKVISKTGSCNCGGGTKISIILPVGVTKEFIESCKQQGFTDHESYTNAGLLYIQKGQITISGALCLKQATVFCSKKSCEQEIDDVISLLESIFNK